MSIAALDWSYSLRGLGGTRASVLHCLAYHHNGETGRCDPSAETVAQETGLSSREVRRCWSELRELGLMSIVEQSGKSNAAVLNIGATPDPESEVFKREKGRKRALTPDPESDVSTPDPESPLTRSPLTPDPESTTPDPESPKQERTGREQEIEQPRADGATVVGAATTSSKPGRGKKQPTPEGQAANAIFHALCDSLGRTVDDTLAGRAMRGLTSLVRAHGEEQVRAAWSPANVRSCAKATNNAYPFATFAGMLTAHSDAHERLSKHAGLMTQEMDQCQTQETENAYAELSTPSQLSKPSSADKTTVAP